MGDYQTFTVLCMQSGIGWLRKLPEPATTAQRIELALGVTQALAWEASTMVPGKNGTAEKEGAQWTRFVDIPLSPFTGGDVSDRYGAWEDFTTDLLGLLGSSHRIGLTYNEGNACFVASVTCRDESSPNKGMTFTAFAGAWERALQIAVFKAVVVRPDAWVLGDGSAPSIGEG